MSSFYKNTAGFRNALRENLGFRGVKASTYFALPAQAAFTLYILYTFGVGRVTIFQCVREVRRTWRHGVWLEPLHITSG